MEGLVDAVSEVVHLVWDLETRCWISHGEELSLLLAGWSDCFIKYWSTVLLSKKCLRAKIEVSKRQQSFKVCSSAFSQVCRPLEMKAVFVFFSLLCITFCNETVGK